MHKLQTALMQHDAELEHKNVEVAALKRDKASLDKLLQEKQSEIQEVQMRLQAAMVSRRQPASLGVSSTRPGGSLDGSGAGGLAWQLER